MTFFYVGHLLLSTPRHAIGCWAREVQILGNSPAQYSILQIQMSETSPSQYSIHGRYKCLTPLLPSTPWPIQMLDTPPSQYSMADPNVGHPSFPVLHGRYKCWTPLLPSTPWHIQMLDTPPSQYSMAHTNEILHIFSKFLIIYNTVIKTNIILFSFFSLIVGYTEHNQSIIAQVS